MNNPITPLPSSTAVLPACTGGWRRRMPLLSVALLSLVASGCYRASGLARNTLSANQIPESNGLRVLGLKSKAGPGDYFLGNDFLQVAIDGTPFGSPVENVLAGAQSGGSIVDVGYIILDSSFRQIVPPGDAMHRLTPVVNQDPALELVFTSYAAQNPGGISSVVMQGQLLDPNHSIAGAGWNGDNTVKGVTVTHTASMGTLDRFCTLQTVITNSSGVSLGIYNLADYLAQEASGYRFVIPATYDSNNNVLNPRWGVEIPGSDFSQPLASAVLAPEVGLLDSESGADTVDSHCSVGFLPVDADNFLVTSDPQSVFTPPVPGQGQGTLVPARLVVGGLSTGQMLAPGATLTYNRRMYATGGRSVSANAPSATTGLFNLMDTDKYQNLRISQFGWFQFAVSGSSQRQGPAPAEIRIERNISTTATPVWQLARVEYLEPTDNVTNANALAGSALSVVLPVAGNNGLTGNYRVVARNQSYEYTKSTFTNTYINPNDEANFTYRYLPAPVLMINQLPFIASPLDLVCPEGDVAIDANGNVTSNLYSMHLFSTHEQNTPNGGIQPLRFTLVGTGGTPDPNMRRQRTFDSYWNASNTVGLSINLGAGQYQFRQGNQLFGTGFTNMMATEFAWLPNPAIGVSTPNTYTAYGTRGPLSNLVQQNLSVFEGQTDVTHPFTIFNVGLPSGWTSFDMPGPTQATTGGYNPVEVIASAMAEGIQVVARTEQDRLVDTTDFYNRFRFGFGYSGYQTNMIPASLSDINRTTFLYGVDPFVVGARSTTLAGFGSAASLFTPPATGGRNGGASTPRNWTLADFLEQGGGAYTVVNRPRGPQGLFTQTGFDPTVPVGQGANAWWNGSGTYAYGKTNGQFDALELLRAEGFDETGVVAGTWFNEFKQVRNDWFALLNQQGPAFFTKALGLSSAFCSLDTPVGLARTYLQANPSNQGDLTSVLSALQNGNAVASTGPFLGVQVGSAGPGTLVSNPSPLPLPAVTLQVNLSMPDWVPVDEIRVIVNGVQVPVTPLAANAVPVLTILPSTLTPSIFNSSNATVWSGTFTVPMPANSNGAWIVVEAGVPLSTVGAYAVGTPWNQIMRGMYPIAVTNPIFVDVSGHGYQPPGL